MSPRRDWRELAERADLVQHGVWYRTNMYDKDHVLGRSPEHTDDGIAWCGRPLEVLIEGWGDPELEGLWITNRRSAHCSECNRREKEWGNK